MRINKIKDSNKGYYDKGFEILQRTTNPSSISVQNFYDIQYSDNLSAENNYGTTMNAGNFTC